MKANELRIGNWIAADGDTFRVDGENIHDATMYPDFLDSLQPIPITPEILEKAGFEWDIFYQGFSNGRYVINIRHEGTISFAYGKRKHDEMQFLPYIKYLHQLQNLFHALTGQELQIDLI